MKFPEEIAYIYTPMKAYKAMHASKYLCHCCTRVCVCLAIEKRSDYLLLRCVDKILFQFFKLRIAARVREKKKGKAIYGRLLQNRSTPA